mgnify:CR=1 FL=1
MQGWDLYALYRKGANIEKLENLGVKLVCGDLRNKESILEGMPFNVDAVFHTGGNVSFHKNSNIEQDQDNIHGTMNMVSASIQKSCKRFIYTSTAASYGIHKGWVTEETKSNALTIPINYFKSKKIAEDIVIDAYKARDFDAVILNPANVVGPYDTKIWGPFAIKLAKTIDELAFLIGHELAHNIYHYNLTTGSSEANSLTINAKTMSNHTSEC